MDEDEYDAPMGNEDALSDSFDEDIDAAMQVALTPVVAHDISGDPIRAQIEALALVQTHVVA